MSVAARRDLHWMVLFGALTAILALGGVLLSAEGAFLQGSRIAMTTFAMATVAFVLSIFACLPANARQPRRQIAALFGSVAVMTTTLLFEDQYIAYREETTHAVAELAKAQQLHDLAWKLAPNGDTDTAVLEQAVIQAEREVAAASAVFVVGAQGLPMVLQQFERALSGAASIVTLALHKSDNKDFYVEHEYHIEVLGGTDAIIDTARRVEAGPLLVRWNRVETNISGEPHRMRLYFSVYELTSLVHAPIYTVCGNTPRREVWLPWLRYRLHDIMRQRDNVCAVNAAAPKRTDLALRLRHANEGKDSISVMVPILREGNPAVTDLIATPEASAR